METNKLKSHWDQLIAVGRALSLEKNTSNLMDQLLTAAINLTGSDGGTLYRLSEKEKFLEFSVLINHSLRRHIGGASSHPISIPPIALYHSDGKKNYRSVAAYCALDRETIVIDDVYNSPGFDFSGAKSFDRAANYRTRSLLVIPIVSSTNELFGVLQLVNCLDTQGKVTVFSSEHKLLGEAIAAQAGITLENKVLLERLENLFLSFIQLINAAIDEKSSHTSGHCNRVPDLTMMLANAATRSMSGPLRTFAMDERDRRELQFAALLHDCGKIATPVHVIDKATKLESINDRIELIRTRMEVLKRDAKVEMLEALLTGEERSAAQTIYEKKLAQIGSDIAFLESANKGSEHMNAGDIERARQIAGLTWSRKGKTLPLLDQDEFENITIPYGTLTKAERTTINNHVVLTIKMLNALPWPHDLRNIPAYAGGHHERVDGKGYPNGYIREQMSIQARIMAVADVFEALTAADRPYKSAKTLSESLNIIVKMATTGHLDPDIVYTFLQEGVYLEYAQKYLNPEQVDGIDLPRYLEKIKTYLETVPVL